MEGNAALKKLGQIIRERRKELALSQEELAEKANLHRNYIGGVERGERNLSYLNLLKIASALEIGLEDLAGRNGGDNWDSEGSKRRQVIP